MKVNNNADILYGGKGSLMKHVIINTIIFGAIGGLNGHFGVTLGKNLLILFLCAVAYANGVWQGWSSR